MRFTFYRRHGDYRVSKKRSWLLRPESGSDFAVKLRPVLAGIAADAVVTGLMVVGERTGLFYKTLARDSEDWLDRKTKIRAAAGTRGTAILERLLQAAFSAAAGYGFERLQRRIRSVPAPGLGLVCGGLLGIVNSYRLGPLQRSISHPSCARWQHLAQRMGLHLTFGAILGLLLRK